VFCIMRWIGKNKKTVQGISFRQFVEERADDLKLVGRMWKGF